MSSAILYIQNYETDPPHNLLTWLGELGLNAQTVKAYAGEAIPKTLPIDVIGVVALGGAMSAKDDEVTPWLREEKVFLRHLVDSNIPVLGICLGAQLLALALDGEVSRLESNEIGIYKIKTVTEDSLFNFQGEISTVQWHEDYVSRLPGGATLIANSETCPTQIFRVGTSSYGIQSHPEADASIVKLWEAKPDNAFKNFGERLVSTEVARAEEEVELAWKPIIQAWGREVLAQEKRANI